MNVKVVRFVSGDGDIIAEVSESDYSDRPSTVTLKNPCAMMPTPEGLAMGPMSPLSECKSLTILRDHVLFIDDPKPELKNAYAEQYGGITLPGGGGGGLVGI